MDHACSLLGFFGLPHAFPVVAFLGAIWLFSVLAGAFAIRASSRQSLWRFWVLFLVALGIGAVGFWTPFSFWPELAYTWANDSFSITIVFSWFFLAPMALAGVALLLRLRNRSTKPTPLL